GQNLASPALFGGGNNIAVGFMSDAVFTGGTAFSGNPIASCNIPNSSLPNIGTFGISCNQSSLQLTTAWTVGAVYEHLCTPNFKTAVGGAYTAVEYNSTAKAMFAQNVCAPAVTVSAGVITAGGQGPFNGGQVGGSTLTQLMAQSAGPLSIAANCDPDWGFFQG